MKLSHQQKKFIKKNKKLLSVPAMAEQLGIPSLEIEVYARDMGWQLIGTSVEDNVWTDKLNQKISAFNLRRWLIDHWTYLLIIFLLVGVAYFNSLHNDFVSDDRPTLLFNKNLGKFSEVFTPRPSIRSFLNYFIYHLFGLVPAAYRALNIFFHLGTTSLFFLILTLMGSIELAFFAAMLYAVHPMLVEAVTWISGGPYVQYTFFCLLSFVFYLFRRRGWRWYAVSFFSYLLSLFSSEKAMAYPLILVLFELATASLRANWKSLIGFGVISAIWIISYVLQIGARISALETEFFQTGSAFYNPLIQLPVSLASYFRLLFWPDKLSFYQSEFVINYLTYSIYVIATLFYFGLIIWGWKKNRFIFFWLGVFLLALSPTLTPVRVAWLVAERYAYFSTMGFCAVVTYFFIRPLEIKRRWLQFLIFFFVGAAVIGLTIRTITRNADWRNEDTLWVATGKTAPSDPKTHNNLGDMYARHGNYQQAIKEFAEAVRINPRYAYGYHNMANIYLQLGEYDKAINNYKKALVYSPNSWRTHQNLANAYFQQGLYDLAEEHVVKAIGINKNAEELYINLGQVYLAQKRKLEAKKAFGQALQLNPTNQATKEGYQLSQ